MQLMLKYDNHFTWHRFRSIVLSYQRIYPDFNVDVEAELEKYVSILLFVYRFKLSSEKRLISLIFVQIIILGTKSTLKNYGRW